MADRTGGRGAEVGSGEREGGRNERACGCGEKGDGTVMSKLLVLG
jgi:hypothetical protein